MEFRIYLPTIAFKCVSTDEATAYMHLVKRSHLYKINPAQAIIVPWNPYYKSAFAKDNYASLRKINWDYERVHMEYIGASLHSDEFDEPKFKEWEAKSKELRSRLHADEAAVLLKLRGLE